MARYTGPTTRISRRFGQYIVGSAKVLERRNFPPGQHGPKSRRKLSEYAVGLAEKQKLRFIYGLLERQFRRTFEIAKRERGVTGERFLQLLETRLDSVVYLLGFAKSRAAARQFVNHGHMRVNGHKVDIASYTVLPATRSR
jgi:small subunit ribosomal protein S4